MIEDINRKPEKGIKIGEKIIFSNHKRIKKLLFNNDNNYINSEEKNEVEYNNDSNIINESNINRNSLIVNKSIELSNNKRKIEKDIIDSEDINKNSILITNSKISTDIFMNVLNFCNNDKDNNDNINANIIQNNNEENSNYKARVNDSKINKKNINIFGEQKFNMNKEKELNKIKGNKSKEKYKIENFGIKDNNKNKFNSNIGNIHDLDNFDDLFK